MVNKIISVVLVGFILWINQGYEIKQSEFWYSRLQMARSLDRPTGAYWAGTFAQFSNQKIIPIDGVVGSEDLFRELKRGKELEYLSKRTDQVIIYVSNYKHWSMHGFYQIRKKNYEVINRIGNWYLIRLGENL